MNTPQERTDYIASIRSLPQALTDCVKSLTPVELDTPSEPGGWTPRQIVHHLADAHMNGFSRMKLVLSETKPILKPYQQDVWAAMADTTQIPVEPSLEILHGLHTRWAYLLESLSAEAWTRQGIHLDNGLVSLDDLLRIYAGHGEAHIRQILRVKA